MAELYGEHFFTLVLILLFSVWLIAQRVTRDKELNYFWQTVICCLLLVIQDMLEVYTSLNPDLRFWRTLLSVAGYTLRCMAAAGLVFVACRPEQRRKIIWLPCIVNFLICCTAFFSDIVFGFDENYAFYRGFLGYLPFIIPMVYLVVILVLVFRNFGDSGRKAQQLILIPCALLCIVSSVLDATHGGVRLHEAMMVSSIFFYIYLRSCDIRRDSLTMLLNRQSMYEDCRAMGQSFRAAASLDMNGLKILNSGTGHRTGDMALKKIGEAMLEASGPDKRAYRIGGDEFVILFTDGDEHTVRETLEKIRKQVGKEGYSLSTGYAMREENEDPESMIRRSDLKMFEDKAQYYQDRRHDRRHTVRERDDSGIARRSLEDSPQPVAVYRFMNHRIETLAVSDGFCRLFGYPDREQARYVRDRNMFEDVHADDRERVSGAYLRFFDGQEDLDIVYRTRGGVESGYRVIHARGSQVHSGSDARIAFVWYMNEGAYVEGDEAAGNQITQALNRALHEESILHAVHYDELTGLPNLAWFFQLAEAEKARLKAEGMPTHLLYMDLTGMRYFNHRYGFAEGDKLLKAFAGELVRIFGKESCCHIAGDHFLAGTIETESEKQIRALFEAAGRMNGGRTLPVRVGIFAASVEEVPVSSAFDRAKMACEAIPASDVSAFHYYDKELQEKARQHQYLVENIDRAVAEKWIRVYYQPIVRAEDETVCDEEALARWMDPVEGFLSPAAFIPALENAGLIYKLDLYVVDQVLEKIRSRMGAGQPVVPQSVNLSRSDFETCDIVEEIRKRTDEAGVPRSMITIEITESVIGRNFDFMKERITRFRDLGFAVWMDDFGSGYSSLNVLQSIPFDLIKFDMSFLRMLDRSERAKIILTEMTRMAASLHVETVCEGVETEEHARFLREIGCTKLQGFYYGKPAPPEAAQPEETAQPEKPEAD